MSLYDAGFTLSSASTNKGMNTSKSAPNLRHGYEGLAGSLTEQKARIVRGIC